MTPELQGKDGFITPRDLFRWADRKPGTYQELAEAGYMLLGERLRNDAECAVVKEVLQKLLPRVELEMKSVYSRIHEQICSTLIADTRVPAVWISRSVELPFTPCCRPHLRIPSQQKM